MTYAYAHAYAPISTMSLRPSFGGHDVKMYHKISLSALRWIYTLPLSPDGIDSWLFVFISSVR